MFRKEIKKLLLEKDMTMTDLAAEIGKILNKKYTLNNFSQKLKNETISYREIKLISRILNCKITIFDNSKN